jgi:hypothetical protein
VRGKRCNKLLLRAHNNPENPIAAKTAQKKKKKLDLSSSSSSSSSLFIFIFIFWVFFHSFFLVKFS